MLNAPPSPMTAPNKCGETISIVATEYLGAGYDDNIQFIIWSVHVLIIQRQGGRVTGSRAADNRGTKGEHCK